MKIEFLENRRAKITFEAEIQSLPAGNNKKNLSQEKSDQSADPQNDEYFIRPFRLLSKTIVRGLGYPVDYSKEGVLKKAVDLFSQRTLYKDHWVSVDHWVGLVKNSSYNSKTDPEGIDAELWIDNILEDNKRIIRGLETGAINRCSVGLSFYWEKSHSKLKDSEFFDLLGEEIDGEEVRIIVTEIDEVYEASLVWWGADDTAKEIEQSQVNNKNITIINSGVKTHGKEAKMNLKKLKQALSAVLGKEIETDEELEDAIQQVSADYEKFQKLNRDQKTQIEKLKKSEEFESGMKKELKDEVLNLAVIVEGEELSELIKQTIEAADFEQLQQFKKDYLAKQEKMFPVICQDCQSSNVARRSSAEIVPKESDPKASENAKEIKTIH